MSSFRIAPNVSGQDLQQQLKRVDESKKDDVLFRSGSSDTSFGTIKKDLLGAGRSKTTRESLLKWAQSRGLQPHHMQNVRNAMPKGVGVSVRSLELVADIVAFAEKNPNAGKANPKGSPLRKPDANAPRRPGQNGGGRIGQRPGDARERVLAKDKRLRQTMKRLPAKQKLELTQHLAMTRLLKNAKVAETKLDILQRRADATLAGKQRLDNAIDGQLAKLNKLPEGRRDEAMALLLHAREMNSLGHPDQAKQALGAAANAIKTQRYLNTCDQIGVVHSNIDRLESQGHLTRQQATELRGMAGDAHAMLGKGRKPVLSKLAETQRLMSDFVEANTLSKTGDSFAKNLSGAISTEDALLQEITFDMAKSQPAFQPSCECKGVIHEDGQSIALVKSSVYLPSNDHKVVYEIKWDESVKPDGDHLDQDNVAAGTWVEDKNPDGLSITDRSNPQARFYDVDDEGVKTHNAEGGRLFDFNDEIKQSPKQGGKWEFRLKVLDPNGQVVSETESTVVNWDENRPEPSRAPAQPPPNQPPSNQSAPVQPQAAQPQAPQNMNEALQVFGRNPAALQAGDADGANPARSVAPRAVSLGVADKMKRGWGSLTGSRFGKSAFARGAAGFFKGLLGYSMGKRHFERNRNNFEWQKNGDTGFYTRYDKRAANRGDRDAVANRHHNRGAQIGSAIFGIATLGIGPGLAALVGLIAGKASATPAPLARQMLNATGTIVESTKVAEVTTRSARQLAQKTDSVREAIDMLDRGPARGRPDNFSNEDAGFWATSDMKMSHTLHQLSKKEHTHENYEMQIAAEVAISHPTASNFRFLMDNYVKQYSTKEINIGYTLRGQMTAIANLAQKAGDDAFVAVFNIPDNIRQAYENNLDDPTARADFRRAVEANIDGLQLTNEEKSRLKEFLPAAGGSDYPRNAGCLFTKASQDLTLSLRDRQTAQLRDAVHNAAQPPAEWGVSPF